MNRREFVVGSAAVVSFPLAGCISVGGDEPDDPQEQAAWYVNEGAEAPEAFVDEVLSIGAAESEDQDGFDVSLEHKLSDAGVSTAGDAEFRANATALSVFESVYSDADVRVNFAQVEGVIDTVDNQGQEEERTIHQVQMLRENAEEINWENLEAEHIPMNAEHYDFNPNYYR